MAGRRVPANVEPIVWATFLAELWRWVAEHGEGLVPTTAVTIVDEVPFMLGSRVKNARVYYHRGSLTAKQVAQLEAVPGWSWQGHTAHSHTAWARRMQALRANVDRHGSVAGLERNDPSLGAWLRVQRAGGLTPPQRAELATIPRALESPTALLDGFLDTLTRWISAIPGRDASHVLHSTVVTVQGRPVHLGKRAAHWRARNRRGELTAGDIARLDAIPGWRWDPPPRGRRPRAIEQLSKG